MKSNNCPGKKQGQLDYIISSNSSSNTLLSTLGDSNEELSAVQTIRRNVSPGRPRNLGLLVSDVTRCLCGSSRMVERCHLMLPLALDLRAEHYVQQGRVRSTIDKLSSKPPPRSRGLGRNLVVALTKPAERVTAPAEVWVQSIRAAGDVIFVM